MQDIRLQLYNYLFYDVVINGFCQLIKQPVYFGKRSKSKGKWCLFPWFILIAILSAFWGLFGPETVCDQTKCYPSPL